MHPPVETTVADAAVSRVREGKDVILSGPTASGKSAVAVELACLLSAEIVSADSMQVYRGLDIGTAKPTLEERRRVPHHLIDRVDFGAGYDVHRFLADLDGILGSLGERGLRAVICGGSGMYLKAMVAGLAHTPAPDPVLRAELERTPLPLLDAELASRDPEAWARIDRRNPRRLVRAVEIARLLGAPSRAQGAGWRQPVYPPGLKFFALRRDKADLRQRIDARVETMFSRGLVEETAALLRSGLAGSRTALQAIGYRQVAEHLRGERDLASTIALVKQRTWQYARRQQNWLERHLPAKWVGVAPDEPPSETARRLAEMLL